MVVDGRLRLRARGSREEGVSPRPGRMRSTLLGLDAEEEEEEGGGTMMRWI